MLFSRGPCMLRPPFLPSPTPLTCMHTFTVHIKNTFFQYKTFKRVENVDDVRHVQSIVQPASLMWQAVCHMKLCVSMATLYFLGPGSRPLNPSSPPRWPFQIDGMSPVPALYEPRSWRWRWEQDVITSCLHTPKHHGYYSSESPITEEEKRMGTWTGVVVFVVYSTCIGQNSDSKTQILGNCPE